MDKKYVFTEEVIEVHGRILHRIKAVRPFGNVNNDDLGGFIEKEENLSHEGDCWVCGDAKVFGNAKVCDNAKVYGNANICGNAMIFDNAVVSGNAIVSGNANICGNAEISKTEDYIVFKNWWSSGRYFTWTRSNNMWRVGCFYGNGDELIKKAYKDSEKSGKEYERVVKYVEEILNEK